MRSGFVLVAKLHIIKFMTPGPEIDQHVNIIGDKMPLVSIVKDKIEPSSAYRKPKLPKSFEELQKQKFLEEHSRILDYQE